MKIEPVHMEPTDSGWFAALENRPASNRLEGEIDCDYLVVGGGWMGLHCAWRLAELAPQAKIVLVDAGRIGNNAAGRCAGFAIDLVHNPRAAHFTENIQADADEQFTNLEGIAYMRKAVEELGVDCDWDSSGKFHAAATSRGETCLEDFADALRHIEKEHRWVKQDEIQAITGSNHYSRALHTPGTVLIQPAKYLVNLMNSLPKNISVYEKSPVTHIDYGRPKHICQTPSGTISAKHVMLCNSAYLTKCGFFENTAIPVYTYASMTRTLTDSELQTIGNPEPFGVIPAESFGTTLRLTNDNRLFLRNVYSYARGFKSHMKDVTFAKKKHQVAFERRYPGLADIRYENTWGGLLVLAHNGGMVFGELDEGVFGTAFCNGTGVARGAAFGKALAEHALGQTSRSVDILLKRAKPNLGYPALLTELGVRATTAYRFMRAGQET